MYIKDRDKKLYSIQQIRVMRPEMSIPDGADLSDIGYYRIESVTPPTPGENEIVVPGEPEEYAPNQWRETWLIQPVPFDDLKQRKLAALAATRYQHETGGIIVAGSRIATDRDSQALITGAWSYSQLNPAAFIDWKGVNGWTQIDATTIAAIATAVAQHVQACFSNERALSELIEAADTVTELNEIDLGTGWPI